MKVAILTTETPHHTHFVENLAASHDCRIFCETSWGQPPFDISHPFEALRNAFELDHWFGGATPKLSCMADTTHVENVNDPGAVNAIKNFQPDATVVFGTRRIRPPLIDLNPDSIFNLHGGDPETYRGLDSHLWAIYHKDFSSITTTIHHLNPTLDDGDVVLQAPVPILPLSGLHELRLRNTEVCIELTRTTLRTLEEKGRVPSRPQRERGRYYSFMPGVLKEVCVSQYRRYVGVSE